MDEKLINLLNLDHTNTNGRPKKLTNIRYHFVDNSPGVVEIFIKKEDSKDEEEDTAPPHRYTLKPLAELYRQETTTTGRNDFTNNDYMPLLMAIEQNISRCYEDDPSINDGQVELAVDTLKSKPEANVENDIIAARVQMGMRLQLSLNPYTRDDVRKSLRTVLKSVQRHHRLSGTRGYLEFIKDYV